MSRVMVLAKLVTEQHETTLTVSWSKRRSWPFSVWIDCLLLLQQSQHTLSEMLRQNAGTTNFASQSTPRRVPIPQRRRRLACAASHAERDLDSVVAAAAAAANAPQRPASRRTMLSMGCACCGSLVLQGVVPPGARADAGAMFSYGEEAGPLSWGGACSAGQQQSPIDLPRLTPASACTLQPPIFRYQADSAVRVKNTGTTIQLNFEPGSQSARWGEAQLELLQLHFHTPSEHAFAGQRLAMEAHLVHKNAATGGLAVIAVMLQPPEQDSSSSSSSNPCLAAALEHVPAQAKAEAPCPVAVDPGQLLPTGPAAQQYIHYRGSLTTPPCSEGVDWLVWQQPLPVTDKQVLAFMRFTGGGASYGHNARPLQPSNGRSLEPDCLAAS